MESREFQNYDDEVTIDLAHFMVSIMKKWKSLLVLLVIGAVLGGVWHWASTRGPAPQAAPAKVTAEMEVAAVYRSQYEKLQAYIERSPFMSLNSEAVVIGENSYYVAENNDAEKVAAYMAAILKDKAVRENLCGILELEDETDLDKMITLDKAASLESDKGEQVVASSDKSVTGKIQLAVDNRRSLCLTVYARDEEQVQMALDFFLEEVKASEKNHGFRVDQISQSVRLGSSVAVRNMQTAITTEMHNALKNCTALESKFSAEDKTVYKLYREIGDVSDYAVEVATANPLKKPVIVAVVLVFLACAWYAVAYLLSGKVKTVDEAVALTRKNILGYVNQSAPRKCLVDRWLDGLEENSFPAPVSATYVAAAVEKLGQAVVVYDEDDAALKAVAEEMTGVASMGLLGQNAETLNKLTGENQVVVLVKLGTTTKMQLQREAALCRQYGISLAGSILVK